MGESVRVSRGWVSGRAVIDRRTIHVEDIMAAEEEFPEAVSSNRQVGSQNRTMLATPLLREGVPVGAITISREELRLFSARQIGLLETFAHQAVIAIENVRLFTELQEKNRAVMEAHAQVTEALEQQTATAEILRVISRSRADVQPVFDTIAESAVRLCEGRYCTVYRFDGELIHRVATHHDLDAKGHEVMAGAYPMRPSSARSLTARAIESRAVVHSADYETDREVDEATRQRARTIGYRTGIAVPMLRAGYPSDASPSRDPMRLAERVPSRPRKSRCLRRSPTRPSSPSRTSGSSASCASGPTS